MIIGEAIVLERTGGTYRVLNGEGEVVTAVLLGSLKFESGRERVVVGDRVKLIDSDTSGAFGIAGVVDRRNVLTRRAPDRRAARAIAANIDHVYVLAAVARPDPVPQLIDRMVVIAEANELPVSVVINKIDLGDPEPLAARMRRAGYDVHLVSARTGEGVDSLVEQLAGRESLFAGPSGVGKSSLLNRIQPGLGLRTAEVSERATRGRHTTTAAIMVPLDRGGFVVDTPGFSDAGLWGIGPRALSNSFPEIREAGECRFLDCRHMEEPDCVVRALVAEGRMDADRYESYRALYEEMAAEKEPWE